MDGDLDGTHGAFDLPDPGIAPEDARERVLERPLHAVAVCLLDDLDGDV